MKTKIVAITQPLLRTEDDSRFLSPEEFIVYAARVSNPRNQLNISTSKSLLKYCIAHQHWSIFEQVSATVEITTSLPIVAQILRHKSMTFQQFSARYAKTTEKGYESITPRRQDEKNRQNSIDDLPPEIQVEFQRRLSSVEQQALESYNWAVENGVAKECARFLIPQSAASTLYMTGSLRSWIHYFQVRCGPETQLEHREVALSIRSELSNFFPTVKELLWQDSSLTTQ